MLVLVANQFCPTRLYLKPRSRKQDYRKLLVNIDPSALMYRMQTTAWVRAILTSSRNLSPIGLETIEMLRIGKKTFPCEMRELGDE